MKFGELLPSMGNDEGDDEGLENNPFVRELEQEIKRYEQLEKIDR